jgi:ADP-heptose:LPS heptosyltransferase
MLKGHSAGIGDILRSSAAWRALRDTFPGAELHLALLTADPGAAAESFIARHHLLRSFVAIDKRTPAWGDWKRMLARVQETAAGIRPDLVIDFEPNGLKSTFATWLVGRKFGAVTAGVGQIPGRGAFYRVASVSTSEFARRRGWEFPLEYTNRDFVCLSALGIERNGRPIELEETEEGRRFRDSLRERCGIAVGATIIGLNIGCGTPDAVIKRPGLNLLKELVGQLQQRHAAQVVLTGAKFEQQVNGEFLNLFPAAQRESMHDLAGQTSLLELCGLIRGCDIFISTDSGPYHMAVGLKAPTLAVFRHPNPVHYHREKHARCVLLGKPEDLSGALAAGAELLR